MAILGILGKILERKIEEVRALKSRTPEAAIWRAAEASAPPRGFARALEAAVAARGTAVIAEVKFASPSRGRIWPEGLAIDPAAIAEDYRQHGAACISCLTDRDFFQGDADYLTRIRDSVAIPVLRKDFLWDPWQVAEARALGADAVLLILAMLSSAQAGELAEAAARLELDVLVEVHDEAEMEAAHALTTPLIGVNNRDLVTFEISVETSVRLAGRLEPGRRLISESGIGDEKTVRYLRDRGISSFLVGEALMRTGRPGNALERLFND